MSASTILMSIHSRCRKPQPHGFKSPTAAPDGLLSPSCLFCQALAYRQGQPAPMTHGRLRRRARFLPPPDCNARIACYTACSRLPALVRRSEHQETPMSDFKYSLTNLKPAEPPHKIALTFPDGARREFPIAITGLDIAKGISPSLAKRTVAMALDGELADLTDPITG